MKINLPGSRRLVGVASLMVAAASASLAQVSNPEAEKSAVYACPKPANDARKAQIAAELRQKSYDKNSLACAMDMRFELAKAAPADTQAQVDALESLVEYIDHVRQLKMFELVQMDWAEYAIRLRHAGQVRDVLVPAATEAHGNDPRVSILAAQANVLLAGPNEPDVRLTALEQLKKVIAADPKGFNGEGQLTIGRIYLDLPTLYGGGADKALPFLEEGRNLAPASPRALRYLAEAHDELGHKAEARDALATLAALAPNEAGQWQLLSDEWRLGEGIAARMGETTLAKQFGTQRNALMSQHPQLLRRNIQTVFGHGGSNPITGDPQYTGEGGLHEPKRNQ